MLCLFVAHLQVQNLKHRTIKSYLSAVRFLHVMEGQGNPFEGSLPFGIYTEGREAGGGSIRESETEPPTYFPKHPENNKGDME